MADGDSLVIGTITIRAGDLFDLHNPTQNRAVHVAANALHLVTRDRTIYSALPFREGDPYSSTILEEAERTLRTKRFIRDAAVTAHRRCGNRIDVEVRTIDNWTLTPSISIGTSGGDNRFAMELQDLNVLGLGKELKLMKKQVGDVQETTFVYGDPNVFGSRHQFRLELGNSDVGERYSIQAGRPFYASTTTSAWDLDLTREILSYTTDAAPDTDIPVTTDSATLRLARRLVSSTLPYARLGGGIRFSRQVTDPDKGADADALATDFDEVYPFLSAQWSDDEWLKRQNFESFRVNEDIPLGLSTDLEIGIITRAAGNDEDAARLALRIDRGWYSGTASVNLLSLTQVQYFGSDRPRHALGARYQHFHWLSERNQLDLRFTAETQRGYSPVHRLSVGGAEGLRAYRTEFQSGENRWLGAAEFRHLTGSTPWSLVNIAVSAFAEVGEAFSQGDERQTLSDVGFGMLISPTRSSRAAINRFDIAFPLVRGDNIADYQIFVGSKINF